MNIPVIATGAVSALGNSPTSAWETICQGKRMLSPLTLFASQTERQPKVGQINFDLPQNCFSRTESLAIAAADQALAEIDLTGLRLGITLSTTVGGVDQTEKFYQRLMDNPALIDSAATECVNHEPSAITGKLAKKYGACGVHTFSTACSTGIHGIGIGAEMIRQNEYDVVLAIATDALSLLTFRGFDSLLLIDYEGTRPFDHDRIGISLGEAAGAILLCSDEIAKKLNRPAKASIAGWGASADAFHMTAPHPEGNGAYSSAIQAIRNAGISPSQIDWICAHGTGTPDNDRSEISAMNRIFEKLPPFTSFKGAMGHTLAASGIVETVYAIEALHHNWIPESVGFKNIDPEIGVSPSKDESKQLNFILKNSFGFGGNNGSIVIARGEQ